MYLHSRQKNRQHCALSNCSRRPKNYPHPPSIPLRHIIRQKGFVFFQLAILASQRPLPCNHRLCVREVDLNPSLCLRHDKCQHLRSAPWSEEAERQMIGTPNHPPSPDSSPAPPSLSSRLRVPARAGTLLQFCLSWPHFNRFPTSASLPLMDVDPDISHQTLDLGQRRTLTTFPFVQIGSGSEMRRM